MDPSRLADIPLFAALERSQLAEIADLAVEVDAPEGQPIALQGENGSTVFVIERGTVEVRADGELLATLGPGDVFGEIAVIAGGKRMATVVATSPVQLIALLNRDVRALGRRSPQTYAHLQDLMSRRLDAASGPP